MILFSYYCSIDSNLQFIVQINQAQTQILAEQNMQQKPPMCQKHDRQILYICSFETCKQYRLLCQVCKQKQTLHFSDHVNYIHRYDKIREFDNSKKTIPQLEKGINDCENYIVEHRKYYINIINSIKQDFGSLKKKFLQTAQKYEQLYLNNFQKQIQKFDDSLNQIRKLLRQYTKQKNQQDSFFTLLFQVASQAEQFNLEQFIRKNNKAFRIRADIINLKSSIALSKNNQLEYKKTDENVKKMTSLYEQLEYYAICVFDKFKDTLGGDTIGGQGLKSSIVNECKSLALSKVSFGNLIAFQSDLRRSQTSNSSQRSLQKVPFPPLNPVVANTREKLKPLQPKNKSSIIFDGPFLYSTGVYFGQFENNKRNGWGQFVFNDGSIYEGQWEKDNISGFGRLIRNDCYYEGYVKNGRANGSGNYEDFYRYYTGEWKNDKRNGTGEQQIKNKSRKYVGAFVDDRYNGRGKLTTEQYVYEGKFKDGLFHGDGKIKYYNGQNFEGSFVEGEKQMGRHTYPDGSYYDGMFKDNVPQGTGQFYWADGLKFSGQWKKGIQQGMGVQIHQDGRQLKGIWKNGKWQKWL